MFQAPKGTRDFYPADHAVRRHLFSGWRETAIAHGFDEIDGPTFEHLDLYTLKSGQGIVSELFSFTRAGGETDYAMRPEFTPTLARMFAAQAGSLPRPSRWFSIGPYFRAERPQRGRLREHVQWNVDIIGDPTPAADAEVVAVVVAALERLGLTQSDVRVKLSDRRAVSAVLVECGVASDRVTAAFEILDKRDRTEPPEFLKRCRDVGLDVAGFDERAAAARDMPSGGSELEGPAFAPVRDLAGRLRELGLSAWCEFDLGIVRGLAYYTGTVFEVHEASGAERAIAGGGRYDKLIELVGGPPTPAVGIAMGDVVIKLVLEDRGLLQAAESYLPRPDVFVISAGKEQAEKTFRGLVARLRRRGFHVRHSDKATRNVGKLLGEAAKARARFAVILGDELETGRVVVKDLDRGEQHIVALEDLEATLPRQ